MPFLSTFHFLLMYFFISLPPSPVFSLYVCVLFICEEYYHCHMSAVKLTDPIQYVMMACVAD